MPRKVAGPAQAKKQVNVRLPADVVEVLEAVAFLEGKSTLQELLGPPIQQLARKKEAEEAVQAVISRRRRYQRGEQISFDE